MATRLCSASTLVRGNSVSHREVKIQAKRRRSKKKDDVELMYEYAGQIFCEMLGQTCYKEFYENVEMEYQEVSLYFHSNLINPGIRNTRQSLFNNDLLRQTSQYLPCRHCKTRRKIPPAFH